MTVGLAAMQFSLEQLAVLCHIYTHTHTYTHTNIHTQTYTHKCTQTINASLCYFYFRATTPIRNLHAKSVTTSSWHIRTHFIQVFYLSWGSLTFHIQSTLVRRIPIIKTHLMNTTSFLSTKTIWLICPTTPKSWHFTYYKRPDHRLTNQTMGGG